MAEQQPQLGVLQGVEEPAKVGAKGRVMGCLDWGGLGVFLSLARTMEAARLLPDL